MPGLAADSTEVVRQRKVSNGSLSANRKQEDDNRHPDHPRFWFNFLARLILLCGKHKIVLNYNYQRLANFRQQHFGSISCEEVRPRFRIVNNDYCTFLDVMQKISGSIPLSRCGLQKVRRLA